ncbi:MAG TPA: hypothetical protein VJA26_12750 [Gammaproteobacteria bacterium]|nr:hypothetical protein [Gammaproteobacteria bacterium]
MNAVAESKPLARILTCSEAEYFADPCSVPSLSQSIAHTLITRSPLHAWAEHPRLGNVVKRSEKEPTKAQIRGTVLHALLLGKGFESVRVFSYDDYRTNVAKAAKAAAIADGCTPILQPDFEEAQVAADAIRMRLAEQGCVLEGGQAEVAIEWYEEGNDGPLLCRGRLDYLIVGENFAEIIDPKKIESADELACMRHADDYGHHIQGAAYVSAVEKLYPHLAGRVKFTFAFMEYDPPFAAVPRERDGLSRWVGEQQWNRAVKVWQQCMNSGEWPSYPIAPLTVTPWTMKREEEYAEQQ